MTIKTELEKELNEAITAGNIAFAKYQETQRGVLEIKKKIAHTEGFIIGRLAEYKGKKGQITHFNGSKPVITFYKKNGDLGKLTRVLSDWDVNRIKFTNE